MVTAIAPVCVFISIGSPCVAQMNSSDIAITPTILSIGDWSRATLDPPASPDTPSDTPPSMLKNDPEGEAGLSQSKWRVELTPWIWLIGVDGDVGVRGFQTNVSADFGDILDGSDSILAFSGRLEIGHGNWAVFVDGTYIDIGADNQTGPAGMADVDVTFEQSLIDFGLKYRVGEWEPTGNAAKSSRNTSLDVFAGARYNRLKLELDPANMAAASGSKDWIDPIIGASAVLPFAERWHLRLIGDIGGFGVNSDLTWSTTAVIGFDFTVFRLPATVFGGYRAIGHDYTEGSGQSRFTWDVIQHGPILGLSLRF